MFIFTILPICYLYICHITIVAILPFLPYVFSPSCENFEDPTKGLNHWIIFPLAPKSSQFHVFPYHDNLCQDQCVLPKYSWMCGLPLSMLNLSWNSLRENSPSLHQQLKTKCVQSSLHFYPSSLSYLWAFTFFSSH